ncbi:hypothetical protein IMY05_017G0114000 [Salix suchowensis]|nr:hypothetical protein IMY05_017G0114000 [Salix suchowensis]
MVSWYKITAHSYNACLKMTSTKQRKFKKIWPTVRSLHPQAGGASTQATTIHTIKPFDCLAQYPFCQSVFLDKNGVLALAD